MPCCAIFCLLGRALSALRASTIGSTFPYNLCFDNGRCSSCERHSKEARTLNDGSQGEILVKEYWSA